MSPIESPLLQALIDHAYNRQIGERALRVWRPAPPFLIERGVIEYDYDTDVELESECEWYGEKALPGIDVYPGARVAGYVIDFLLRDGASQAYMAIECDGHEFHERTKQQASSDRARDRALLRVDVPTIRFTGSDIYRDVDDCAREVFDTLAAVASRSYDSGGMAGAQGSSDAAFERGARTMRQVILSGGYSMCCLPECS